MADLQMQSPSSNSSATLSWQDLAADKRSRILSQVPKDFDHSELTHSLEDTAPVISLPNQFLSREELAITSLDAVNLVRHIRERSHTSVDVLNAFVHRAVIAHRLLNCCLDFPYTAALRRAEQLDEHLARTNCTVGPLHGLPISVKDQCRLKGTETTCGFIYPIGHPDIDDAVVVQILQKAGAVIFAKTSLSIGCMWGETVNNILDRTSNPYNRNFSCGGSSGGEGALIGFHGSPLGFGSDLAGSIRSPSAYQGLYGLKPSNGRIPYHGILNSMEGQETIKSVVGPMSTSIESVEMVTRVIVESQPWLLDPNCHPLPWQPDMLKSVMGRKLKIGLLDWDGICLPQPPIRNSLKQTADLLRKAGHVVIPWKMDQKLAVDLAVSVFRSDAAADLRRRCALSGEPPMESGCDSPDPPLDLSSSWELAMKCLDFRAEVMNQWNQTASDDGQVMDAYISPVNPAIAPRHGDYSQVRYFAYTVTPNILDYSACTFPTGFVDPAKDGPDDLNAMTDATGHGLPQPTCERDQAIREKYSSSPAAAEAYRGMPITLQAVCCKLEEEKVIAIVKMISSLLQQNLNPPV